MPLRLASRWATALQARPREVRDTLWLLAVLAWIQALLLGHVPGWTSVLAGGVLLWRGWLAWHGRPLPGWPWRVGLTALAVGATVATHRTLLGPEAGVTLIVVLLSLKTLELRARRDAWVVFFLAFFTLLAPLLRSQSLPMALGVLLAVAGLLTSLVLAHRPLGHPPLAAAARQAGWLMLTGTPLLVLLFALFPRLPPLWGLPQGEPFGRSGLSGQMRVGDVARLALDERVAMRVAFPQGTPPAAQLYFRGPVLRVFDGERWLPLHGPQAVALAPGALIRADAGVRRTPRGAPLPYRVTLEPTQRPWLPVLDHTLQAPQPSAAGAAPLTSPDGAWWLPYPVTDVLRYDAQAHPTVDWGVEADRLALQVDRELPPGFNPRTLAWAQALRRELGEPAPRVLLEALLRRLRDGGYVYTLEPGVYGPHSADEFWFERKAGFCEHIASAFVIALRALDVPARIVTGYQGGERNPVDGLWTVRHSDAHAWAEVWLPGEGWVRIDPTAWVAPDRTERGARLQAPAGPLARAVVQVDPRLLQLARAWWDAANQRWNEWVLDYGPTRQLELLRRLGWAAQDWRDAAQALAAALGAAALLAGAWLLLPARRRADAWARLLQRAARRAARAGVAPPRPLTPRALAAALEQAHGLEPAARAAWRAWLLELEALRYDPAMNEAARSDRAQRALARRLARLPLPARKAQAAAVGLLLALAGALTPPAAEAQPHPARTTYADHAAARALAEAIDAAEGWDDGWARHWLAQAQPDLRARALNVPPPPTAYPNWAAYRARFVEPRRIAAGVRFWDAHAEALARAEARYGVPAAVIVGILGVETLYGQHLGQHRTLDVLATLALDFPREHPRAEARQAFFRDELRAFLRLARSSGVPPDAWRGSFAGALGWPQFMPSSWLAHAVDFDGDGRIDLIGSPVDAIGSVASFLAAHGWQRGVPARFSVTPPTHPQALGTLLAPDIRPTFSAAQLRELGAELPPEAQRHDGPMALVLLHNGDPARGGAAPTYVLGTQNFWALTRYNRSSYYALAVLELGEAVERMRAHR
ncbi:Protein-glutamine gamma-glutamyltransferase [Tepidimonas alkaliphilus]|uniref:Protein-glutamine gamma-glutamyltransferase n=1 Tax=Tepidimonas alkaliphilus TaxID=2588942 RepID=A0A554WA05_9BURK|nr:transglutaminaseTgpA domain-containing protein [Tepidimonas alkaliphilus]TSE20418.1 Protein-glutamine gamma-glutamyltransferase [Tepidimonas alkaliphilus]